MNPCCTADWPDLLEVPDHVDAKELLGLLLAVYPGEMEDNPMLQVHYKGGVGSNPGAADYRPPLLLPEH